MMAARSDKKRYPPSGPLLQRGASESSASLGDLAAVSRTLEPLASGYALLDSERRIVLANPAFARLTTAATPAELLGVPLVSVESQRWRGPDLIELIESQLRPPRNDELQRLDPQSGEEGFLFVRAHALERAIKDVATVIVEFRCERTEAGTTPTAVADYERRLRSLELARVGERTRRAIARDLHDGLSQALVLASMKLGGLRDRLPTHAQAAIREVEDVVRQAHDDLAALTFRLSPPPLRDGGLDEAIRWVADDTGCRFGLRVDVKSSGSPTPLDEERRVELLRAARELLINVAKHSGVEAARVELSQHGDRVKITVGDDGSGFDPSRVSEPKFGLFSIRERARELGGELRVRSSPGKGTRATLVLPRLRPEE